MIKSQELVDKICNKINQGGLTSLQSCQANNALVFLDTTVVSVATYVSLPGAANYEGRMIYVTDEGKYYYAHDGFWLSNFSSTVRSYYSEAWAWGCNGFGQLGDGTTVNKSSPISVVGGFTDWCQVSAGCDHILAIRTNGTAWSWGFGGFGRLGDGTTVNKSSPISVVGGFTDWCQVSAGRYHNVALRTNGTAWAWGNNTTGELGDNTAVAKSSPVSVVGGFTDWCQVSAGGSHSLGLRTNGTAWSWGNNNQSQLGDNTVVTKSSPVSVVGGFTDWCQVAAGGSHSLGLRTNGTAWSWGFGGNGRLGDNTTVNKSSPVSVVGGFTDWCQVSAGRYHSFGLRTNGTAWAWGLSSCGRLGDNTTVDKSSPVSVVGGFTDWCQVSAGGSHSLGLRTNGTAWSWGNNNQSQLGDNTVVTKSSPVSVVGGFTDWCQVAAGGSHSLGLRFKGTGF